MGWKTQISNIRSWYNSFCEPSATFPYTFQLSTPISSFFQLRETTRTRLSNCKKKEIQGHTGNVSLVTKKEEDEFLKIMSQMYFSMSCLELGVQFRGEKEKLCE